MIHYIKYNYLIFNLFLYIIYMMLVKKVSPFNIDNENSMYTYREYQTYRSYGARTCIITQLYLYFFCICIKEGIILFMQDFNSLFVFWIHDLDFIKKYQLLPIYGIIILCTKDFMWALDKSYLYFYQGFCIDLNHSLIYQL